MVTQCGPEKHSAQRGRVCLAYHDLLRMSDVLGTALVNGQATAAREVGRFRLSFSHDHSTSRYYILIHRRSAHLEEVSNILRDGDRMQLRLHGF
jgi:uncharacterized heparinase superfamily protein